MTLLERFESKISSLQESKDLTTISLVELMSAFQPQEQRRALRQEKAVERCSSSPKQISQQKQAEFLQRQK